MAYEEKLRVPKIVDIQTAIHVYLDYPELGNKEIQELFGRRSPNTISRLKKAAWAKMREEGACVNNDCRVPTCSAFRAWGLDIDDLEKRYAKLKKYGMLAKGTTE